MPVSYADIAKAPQLPDTNDIRKLMHCINESVARASGAGSYYGKYQAILSRMDRLKYNIMPPHSALPGYTFITRPKLNFSTSSLRQNRISSLIASDRPDTIPFMVRCLLDTDYAKRPDIREKVKQSPFLDPRNPFIVPLCNSVVSSSGWPTKVMEVETTPDGFRGENMTYAKGTDDLAKTYDINLTIREIPGAINLNILFNWFLGTELLTSGVMTPYKRFIYGGRLCYDASIYRFVLDSTRTRILVWTRATSCFMKSFPMGQIFDENENEYYVSSMSKYNVPFVANMMDHQDPIVLQEFNMLTERYWPALKDPVANDLVDVTEYGALNYAGIPHIDLDGTNRLRFYATREEVEDPAKIALNKLMNKIRAAEEIQKTNEMKPPTNDSEYVPKYTLEYE